MSNFEDKTDVFSFGGITHRRQIYFNLENNQQSSWNIYPNKYKFMSVHYVLHPDVSTTYRTNYNLVDLCVDIGGLMKFLMFVG